MKHLISFAEGAGVALLGQVPALASSHAVQDFVARHPADAALVPIAVGLVNVAYAWLKAKTARKPVPVGSAAGPVATGQAASVTVTPSSSEVPPAA